MNRRAAQRGAGMVETALVLILFLSMVYGIVYAALIMFGWNNVAFAARQATRYASVHGSTSSYVCSSADIQTLVRKVAGLHSATAITTWNPNNTPGSSVKVYVSVPSAVYVPLVSLKSVVVASSSQMTILQ